MQRLGYAVQRAASGESALALCAFEPPDLAILEVGLPGMDGLDLARRLRETTPVPHLFLSACGERQTIDIAVRDGALGYLIKPLEVEQIVPSIEAALARGADLGNLRQSESGLHEALVAKRETAMAVGIVMERYRLGREPAFEALRTLARSERRRLEEVAEEIVRAPVAVMDCLRARGASTLPSAIAAHPQQRQTLPVSVAPNPTKQSRRAPGEHLG